jgi:hypothetical protein
MKRSLSKVAWDVALVKMSAAWSSVPIAWISMRPGIRCSLNQWYLTAIDFDLGVIRGGSELASVRHAALSSQIVDLILDCGSVFRSGEWMGMMEHGVEMLPARWALAMIIVDSGDTEQLMLMAMMEVNMEVNIVLMKNDGNAKCSEGVTENVDVCNTDEQKRYATLKIDRRIPWYTCFRLAKVMLLIAKSNHDVVA